MRGAFGGKYKMVKNLAINKNNIGWRKNPGPATKVFGVTSPISTASPEPIDLQRTTELLNVLKTCGTFDTEEERYHQMDVIGKIIQLVNQWVRDTCLEQNMPSDVAENIRGKLYTFGSYRLGVHTKGSDIDILCVSPEHVDRSLFFTAFVDLLKQQPEVKDLLAVEEAFVPLIKMTFDGIDIDMLFARLPFKDIPEDQELGDAYLLKNLDPKCVRSLNGSRNTDEIMNLVPNRESFCLALRSIKYWAKRRGLYSNVLGYLGGVSWAILVARTCQLYPNAAAATIVLKFFLIFAQWPWPKSLHLKQAEENELGFTVWDARVNVADRQHLMPIITPAYPQQNSAFNVSSSTRRVIEEEFKRGLKITDEIMQGKCEWTQLFEHHNFFSKYKHFIAVILATKGNHLKWHGLLESKIRLLVTNLESNPYIRQTHVNPETFTPSESEPDTCQSMWFIGLRLTKAKNVIVDLKPQIQNFSAVINHLMDKETKIQIRPVKRSELNKYLPDSLLMEVKEKASGIPNWAPVCSPSTASSTEAKNETKATESKLDPPEVSVEVDIGTTKGSDDYSFAKRSHVLDDVEGVGESFCSSDFDRTTPFLPTHNFTEIPFLEKQAGDSAEMADDSQPSTAVLSDVIGTSPAVKRQRSFGESGFEISKRFKSDSSLLAEDFHVEPKGC